MLALLLSLVMVVSLLPMAALAEEPGGSQPGTYVLMNIPYAQFYAAEKGETGTVDAVSGATLKYANSGIAGGSYHDADAVDAGSQVKALGVTYPVLVTDLRKLDPALEVKADGKKTIGIVTGREKTITPTEVTGADQLFCAPSYSWMTMEEVPARYKTMTEDESGALSFGAVSGSAATVEGVTGSASYNTYHGNFIEVRLNGVTIEEAVSGVLVTFDDGSVTALPHVQGFWQKTQIGWASPGSVAGKTITKVRFLTRNSVYDCPVTIPVKRDSGPITAEFRDTTTLAVTGLPADIETPVATVRSQVGRGETPAVIAENVPVTDGQITTTSAAVDGTAYAVTVTSDNYGDLSATAKLPDLSQVTGTYQPLFEGATFNSAYDHYWHDYTAAVVGGSAANDTVAYMKASVGAKGYGENNEAPNFFCGFTNDVAAITFGGEDGRTVTFTKADRTSVTHTYAYVKEAAATGKYGDYDMEMKGNLYRAQEETADEFQYLLMFPDTPDTTYHLEFRYAGTEADVLNLLGGPYAYWVGSALRTSALTEENEDTLQKVISLFVVENLAEMKSEETSAQRAGLAGTWDFLDSAVLKAYGFDSMYIVLSADGTGKTFAAPAGGEPMQISAYTFFAYDPVQADDRDSGTYLAMNPVEETVTPGEYEITTINGRKALVFTSNEGEITYYLRKEQTPSHSGGGGGTVTPDTNAITISNAENGTVSADFTKAKAGEKVTVTVKPDEGYRADAVKVTDKDGKEIPVTDNGNGTYSFTMPASQASVTPVFVKADTPVPTLTETGRFADVPKGAYYSGAVDWAVAKGITTGIDDTRFAPNASCTRAQMVTFLWRAAGSPEPVGRENPFADVRSDAYYAKAVLWAVEKGVTQGADASHFSPSATVNRAQSVTFLYRFCGERADGSIPFTDIAEGAYYYDAVLWAVAQSVTNGTSATAFSPGADCTRGQIVTFLYRAMDQA